MRDSEFGDHKSHYRRLQSRRLEKGRAGPISEKMEKTGGRSRLELGHQDTEKGQLPSGQVLAF